MNDRHALITQLCDELDHCRRCLLDDRRVTHPLADRARTVLARWGQQPAPLAEPEPEFPTTQELKTFACEWWRTFGLVKNKATCTWVLDQVDPEHFADFSRDLLARWGHQPAPPAEGEVGEVVRWLRSLEDASVWFESGSPEALKLTRAADLLAQRHPTPVPVSERLPGPEDCNEMGLCWWFDAELWCLDIYDHEYTHWLPAHSLPLPATTRDIKSND